MQGIISPQVKKEFIQKEIENGDKRGWNAIAADLELKIWTKKFGRKIEEPKTEVNEQEDNRGDAGSTAD